MGRVFISYRRGDAAGYARSLATDLQKRFGGGVVFHDIDIEPGTDFVEAIEGALAECVAFIVLIGKDWLDARDAQGRRRLWNDEDFVSLEIRTALARGIRIFPVLVHGASMPNIDDLPGVLQAVARRQALEVTNTRWDYDVGKLCEHLQSVLGTSGPNPAKTSPPEASPKPATNLDGILGRSARQNLLRVELDARVLEHLEEVREYVGDFLQSHGEFPHFKVAVGWVASEMIDNAFRHGGADSVTLNLDRTTRGVIVEVVQPDIEGFDVVKSALAAKGNYSFLGMAADRGLRWRQHREGGRLAISLELPRDLELRPATPTVPGRPPAASDVSTSLAQPPLRREVQDGIAIASPPMYRIDQDNADDFRGWLEGMTTGCRALVMDLSSIAYVSSAGLRAFMLAMRMARGKGLRLAIAAPTPEVQEIFAISMIDRVFPFYANVEEALRALEG